MPYERAYSHGGKAKGELYGEKRVSTNQLGTLEDGVMVTENITDTIGAEIEDGELEDYETREGEGKV